MFHEYWKKGKKEVERSINQKLSQQYSGLIYNNDRSMILLFCEADM
jgi:hypothetical protein